MGKTALYTEERVEEMLSMEEDGEGELPEPMSRFHIILLNLSWFGLSLMMIVLSVEVLPPQIQAMVGENSKGRWLGGIVAIGGVLTFFSGPIVGMQSDRLVSTHGKRRPVMLGGAIILCMSLFGMAFSAPQITISQSVDHPELCTGDDAMLVEKRCANYRNSSGPVGTHEMVWYLPKSTAPGGVAKKNKFVYDNPMELELKGNIWLFAVFYMFMTISGTAVLVAYSALLADKSHPHQRGLISGVMGTMVLSGQVAGACLGFGIAQLGVLWIYSCVVLLIFVCILITVFTTTEAPSKPLHTPLSTKDCVMGFFRPLAELNFRWVFITKLLMQQGLYSIMAFLEYWLSDMTVLPFCWSPQRSVAMYLFPLMSTAALTSVLCGCLSDKLERRREFVLVACLVMSAVAVVYACIEGDHAYTIAISLAFLYGAGFGCFHAVDFALLLDVLPDQNNKAKDIAVWSQATVLAQALATPIAGIIVDVFEAVNCEVGLGYRLLFTITAIYFMLSGLFILRIKGIK